MFETMTRWMMSRWLRRRTIVRLEKLDDWLLADLGTSRSRLGRFVDGQDNRR